MKLTRVALLAVATLVVPSAIAASKAQTSWTLFQPPGDGFRVEFPGAPAVTRDTVPSSVGPAPHLKAELTSRGFNYSVELTTFASASPSETVLDYFAGALDSGGKVRSRTRLKVGADPARRTVFEVGDGEVIATSLMVTDGMRFYHVLCVALRGHESSAEVEHFIKSFRLAPP